MTRSTPPDYREFVRVSVDLPLNPKLAMVDEPAAGWAYVVSLCYCGQNLTDGSFPLNPVMRLAGVKRQVAKLLVEADLWHETGHRCLRCPQPLAGMVVVHDYLEHQRSGDEARSLREARREAGRKGAAKRWAARSSPPPSPDGISHGNSHSNAIAGAWHSDGTSMPEVEVEVEQKTSSSERAARKRTPTRLPAGWQPNDAHRRYAGEHRLDVDHEAGQFRAHADANDRSQASWDAAFRKWLGNSVTFRKPQHLRAVPGGHQTYRNPTDPSVWDEPLLEQRELS